MFSIGVFYKYVSETSSPRTYDHVYADMFNVDLEALIMNIIITEMDW